MQSKSEVEQWYGKPDPWGFISHPDDIRRKRRIIITIQGYGQFQRALDIGAGEGWLTGSLPSEVIHGYELSDAAAARFPPNVERVLKPTGTYDLVVATGVLYPQYDWPSFTRMIKDHASQIVLTSNIKTWEVADAVAQIPGEQILDMEFPYREYVQKLRVFKIK